MFKVLVEGGFDSIELESVEEGREYGSETNCEYDIIDLDTGIVVYSSEDE